MVGSLTPEQCAAYARDGVLFPVPVISADEAARLRDEVDRVASEIREAGGDGKALGFRPWESSGHPLYDVVDQIVRDPHLLDAVESLLGPTVLVRTCDVFLKDQASVSDGSGITWHWDDPRLPGADTVLTAWVALTPSGPENGGVRYVLGSHRATIERKDPCDPGVLQMYADDWGPFQAFEKKAGLLEPGEVAMHHSNMVHGSPPNPSEVRRMGIAVRYFTPESPPDLVGASMGVLVRGDITDSPYQLKPQYPVMWWDPGAPMDVKAMREETKTPQDINSLAEAGDVSAQHVVGMQCLWGPPEKRDLEMAFSWFEKAASAGHDASRTEMGVLLLTGVGCTADSERAMALIGESAKAGDPGAHVQIGKIAVKSGDAAEAERCFRLAAEGGNSEGQFHLAEHLQEGRGGTKDESSAMEWFSKAVAGGHVQAHRALGELLLCSEGEHRDAERAIQLLSFAAECGEGRALLLLSKAHRGEFGMLADAGESTRWLRLSAEKGSTPAQRELGELLIAEDDTRTEGMEWLSRAAEQGDGLARVSLARARGEEPGPEPGHEPENTGPVAEESDDAEGDSEAS